MLIKTIVFNYFLRVNLVISTPGTALLSVRVCETRVTIQKQQVKLIWLFQQMYFYLHVVNQTTSTSKTTSVISVARFTFICFG